MTDQQREALEHQLSKMLACYLSPDMRWSPWTKDVWLDRLGQFEHATALFALDTAPMFLRHRLPTLGEVVTVAQIAETLGHRVCLDASRMWPELAMDDEEDTRHFVVSMWRYARDVAEGAG